MLLKKKHRQPGTFINHETILRETLCQKVSLVAYASLVYAGIDGKTKTSPVNFKNYELKT
jgi:hypothetical protein